MDLFFFYYLNVFFFNFQLWPLISSTRNRNQAILRMQTDRQAGSADTNVGQQLDTDGLVHVAWWPWNIFKFVHWPACPGFIWDYGLLSNIEHVLYALKYKLTHSLETKSFWRFLKLKKILTEWFHRKYIPVVEPLWLDFKLIILGEMQIRLEVDFVFVIILFAGKCSKSLPVFSIYFRLITQFENDFEQWKLSLHAFGWNSHLIFIEY